MEDRYEYVKQYVREHIDEVYDKKLAKIRGLQLKDIIKRKNPFLFKVKNAKVPRDVISDTLSALVSSSEETQFGDWLERLAVFINGRVYGGMKGASEGIDLEFTREGQRYLVAIKSGPVWGNSAAFLKLSELFNAARKRLQTSGARVEAICVNGCSYGNSGPDTEYKEKYNFYQICGQRYWELISGDADLYKEIILALESVEDRAEEFKREYDLTLERLAREFTSGFTNEKGEILWDKWLEINSGAKPARVRK